MASWKFHSGWSSVSAFFGSRRLKGASSLLAVAVLVSACGGDRNDTGQAGTDPRLGQVTEALGTPPESGCNGFTYNGHDYWFCSSLRTWSTARTKCEAQGYNLVRVEDSAENAFVKSHIGLDAWIGGNDATTEGTWVWTFGGSNFWVGTASGHTVNGLFANWNSGEPNNLGNQDCGKMLLDGTWRDESCSLSLRYVCESGADQCLTDANKVVPGLCGCGVSDVDTDGDGTPDCQDQCPNDATKIRPGDCGCSNAPRAAGTSCSDGLCAANTTCNGAGVCGNPASCPAPDTNCTFGVFQNNYYWFCAHDRAFSDGRQRCQNVGMDVTAIESAAEDDFIESKVSQLDHVFIGGTDEVTEGTFVWKSTGQQFWSGGPSGSATSGAYTNWESGEPSDGVSGKDCMAKDPGVAGGQWEARSCTLNEGFICESKDACPFDPLKTTQGFCGCGRLETNTDGDALPDCVDECPTDPNKTKRGVCDCGKPETDSDGDGVPNCIDDLPNDVGGQQAGSCGKPGSFTPAGTPCNDGPCAVVATCDGAGHCGNGSACIPPNGGTCKFRQILGKTYWFCPATLPRDQAEASCRSRPGQALVRIETSQENALMAAQITTDTWIGANDLGADGDWRWATATSDAGPPFWSGGASGSRYFGAYANWLQGQPGGGAAEACGAMLASGTNRGFWDDLACSASRGFVCEVVTDGPPIDNGYTPAQHQPCTPQTTAFPTLDLSTEDSRKAEALRVHDQSIVPCGTACPNDPSTEQACLDACENTEFLKPGPDGQTCAQWNPADNDLCELETVAPPPPGSTDPAIKCISDAQCPAPFRCGHAGSNLIGSPNPYGSEKVCGTPRKFCPTIPDPFFNGRCADNVLVCASPEHTQNTPGWDPSNPLEANDFNGDTYFGSKPEPTGEYAPGTQTPCPPPCQGCVGSCVGLGRSHPWCKYAPDQKLRDLPPVTDNSDSSASGDSQLVTFNFDPQLELNFASQIGGLGLPLPDVHAKAGVKASVHVTKNIVPTGADFDIIDVAAQVDGGKCTIGTANSHARLLNIDFVPVGHANKGGFDIATCEHAYGAFAEATNRTNKAMRDAQALLTQYYAALNSGHPLKKFCETLAPAAILPEGFPAPEAGTSCADEMPAKTVARFIEYYKRTIYGFPFATIPILSTAAESLRNATPPTDPISLFDLASGSEEANIATATFFIGPIPVLLQAYAALSYGVDVRASFSYAPGAFVASSLLNPNVGDPYEVAFVGVKGGPHANARLGLFAGVGFDFGVAEAKFGVSAELSLGTVEVPATAGAGLFLTTEVDPRDQPADIGDPVLHAAGNMNSNMIPPKKYVARVGYAVELKAATTDILSGSVNGELALEFLFFSLSWRQEIFGFTGFCPTSDTAGCSRDLFTIQGDVSQPNDAAWDKIRMPSPLPVLVPPEFFANAALTAGDTDVDVKQFEQLFYDRECACVALGRECVNTEECCDSDTTLRETQTFCMQLPGAPHKTCELCRNEHESCTETANCCSQPTGADALHCFAQTECVTPIP